MRIKSIITSTFFLLFFGMGVLEYTMAEGFIKVLGAVSIVFSAFILNLIVDVYFDSNFYKELGKN